MFATSRDFLAMFRHVHKTNTNLRTFNPIRCTVSTMTIKGLLGGQVPFQTVRRKADVLKTHGLDVQEHSKFLNQMSVKSGGACIKIFQNGSVQCTGLQSPLIFVECMDRLCSVLEIPLESSETVMINVNFDCRRSIPLAALRDALDLSYDPDCSYSGVRGRIECDHAEASVMAFATGRVILSGSSPSNIHVIYNVLCTKLDAIFDRHADMSDKQQTNKSKGKHMESYMIHNGYSSRLTMFDI